MEEKKQFHTAITALWTHLKKWLDTPPETDKEWEQIVAEQRAEVKELTEGRNAEYEQLVIDLYIAVANYFKRREENGRNGKGGR